MGQSLDFVRLEVERLIQASNAAVDSLPDLIRERLAGPDGPTIQVTAAAQTAQSAIGKSSPKCSSCLTSTWIRASPTRHSAKLLVAVNNLLDPKRDDSIQKRLHAALPGTCGRLAGAMSKAVKATVENAMAPLQAAIETFSLALKKEEGIEEALATTTRKGFAFEDELLPELQRWAAIVGKRVLRIHGAAEPSGRFHADARATDSIGGMPSPKIVVEARTPAQSLGRARVAELMNATLARGQPIMESTSARLRAVSRQRSRGLVGAFHLGHG